MCMWVQGWHCNACNKSGSRALKSGCSCDKRGPHLPLQILDYCHTCHRGKAVTAEEAERDERKSRPGRKGTRMPPVASNQALRDRAASAQEVDMATVRRAWDDHEISVTEYNENVRRFNAARQTKGKDAIDQRRRSSSTDAENWDLAVADFDDGKISLTEYNTRIRVINARIAARQKAEQDRAEEQKRLMDKSGRRDNDDPNDPRGNDKRGGSGYGGQAIASSGRKGSRRTR